MAGPNASMDEDEAVFWCSDGPSSAGWMIGTTLTGTYTSKFGIPPAQDKADFAFIQHMFSSLNKNGQAAPELYYKEYELS